MAKAKKKVAKKTAKRKVILPKVMSKLIRIALKDVRKAEKTPDVFVDMGTWFEPTEISCRVDMFLGGDEVLSVRPACVMCAAGSVMAFSLGKFGSKDELEPYDFPKNERQLEAINYLRTGDVIYAATCLGLIPKDEYGHQLPEEVEKFQKLDTYIPEYNRKKPEPFHKAMEKLAAKLEKAGY